MNKKIIRNKPTKVGSKYLVEETIDCAINTDSCTKQIYFAVPKRLFKFYAIRDSVKFPKVIHLKFRLWLKKVK